MLGQNTIQPTLSPESTGVVAAVLSSADPEAVKGRSHNANSW
jgi:hypothetical protein